ncbi:hypothetical protein [uncultured Senegalimassilia sp.]|uniref:hypothetical protein n=1 Tax=uncultured Senegalimassilia sp. TaxID=1714350 RepID=UPI0026DF7613|nr:hypothetical protein [uncultured Senegalimassilia sp.]
MKATGQHTNHEELHASQNAAEGYRAVADEHAQTLKDFWKRFMVSGLFVVAAFVIILACLAWFLNNSQVKATGVGVDTAGARFAISSDGTQQGIYDWEAGKAGLDVTDSMNVSATSNLVNLSAGDVLGPGSYGQLTFTVTPYANDLGNVQIDLSRELKGKQGADVSDTVKALASGHLLFFESRDANGYYESPILNDLLTIAASDFRDSGALKPVTKTLYWVWPEYIQNFVYTGNANYYKNLFAADNDSYKDMQKYINDNKGSFYSGPTAPNLSSTMASADLSACATAYNKADDQIGNAVEYYQVRLTASEVTTP